MSTRYGTAKVELPSDTEIVISRVFDAPASLVFDVWTKPEHVRRWWTCESEPLVVCDIDLRVGGAWRYVVRNADGTELGWHGTYREIDRPRRLVSTEVFEPFPDSEAVNNAVFTEDDGKTTVTVTVRHPNKEARDGHVNSGMEGGMQHALDRVEDILRSLVTA